MVEEGGTGAPEIDSSDGEETGTLREQITITIERLPASVWHPFPESQPVTVHTVRAITASTTITVSTLGFEQAPTDFILLVAQETINAARQRIQNNNRNNNLVIRDAPY